MSIERILDFCLEHKKGPKIKQVQALAREFSKAITTQPKPVLS